MILNVRKCCQGHARGRRVSRGATLQHVGLEAIGVAPLPRSLSSRFGFGIYFTLQVAAHFFCYDGAVLGTILQGVIAPPLVVIVSGIRFAFLGPFVVLSRACLRGRLGAVSASLGAALRSRGLWVWGRRRGRLVGGRPRKRGQSRRP